MTTIHDTHPEYALTSRLDDLRSTEYSYLDEHEQGQGHTYLDYTGSGLASRSQHQAHHERVTTTLFGNPHSVNPTSEAATRAADRTRARILSHLNASPEEYVVIFTPNATGAARLVAESYPFTPDTKLVLTADNHNSINGIREYARAKGTKTTYVPLTTPDLRVDEAALHAALSSGDNPSKKTSSSPKEWFRSLFTSCLGHRKSKPQPQPTVEPKRASYQSTSTGAGSASPRSSSSSLKPSPNEKAAIETSSSHHAPPPPPSCSPEEGRRRGLFAYPAQSNFSGTRHPLSYIPLAQSMGYHVLLDTAAYLPTSCLDLSSSSPYRPDFCIISFYKLFGYPTGVGCLVARRSALSLLSQSGRPWFSGGTIRAVTTLTQWVAPSGGHELFEDGTINFGSIPDVITGLDFLTERVGMAVLEARVKSLTGYLLYRLTSLKHTNGRDMVIVYGPKDTRCEMRGGTVAFNLLDKEGKVVDERIIDTEAADEGISLRTGCFCNPGAAEAAFCLSKANLEKLGALENTNRREGEGGRAKQTGRKDGEVRDGEKKEVNNMDEYIRLVGLPSAGAIRVSFGVASNVGDLERLLGFLEGRYRDREITEKEVAGLRARERW